MFALASMLLATGCSQEEEIVNSSEELVEVTFNLKTGEEPSSRAISDGKKAKELYWTVFNQNGDVIPQDEWTKTMSDPTVGTTVKFTLVKGQTYDFVFWAQTAGTDYYTITEKNLKEITVNYKSKANDEARDAFFGMEDNYKVEGHFTKTVYLNRPFGQLNVGTTIEDYNKAATLLLDKPVNHSKLVVKNLPNKLNLLTGEVSGSEAEAVFKLAALPKDADTQGDYAILEVETDATRSGKEQYVHLSMNYLLASTESAIKNVSILLANGDDESDEVNTIIVPNAPIQRNYRTNIVGRLLTADGEFTIVVDPAYTGEHTSVNGGEFVTAGVTLNGESYQTLQEALNVAKPGDVINLGTGEQDFTGIPDLSTMSSRSANEKATIIIQGAGEKTILNGPQRLLYANGHNVELKDLTLKTANSGYVGGFGNSNSVKFTNCTIEGQYYCYGTHTFDHCTIIQNTGYLYTYASDCTFNNCTFNALEGRALQVYEDATEGENKVIIRNCKFEAAKQALTWDGKDVTAIDINSNGAKFDVVIENCSETGFPVGANSGSTLWNIKDAAIKCDAEIIVTVDDVCYVGSNKGLAAALTADKEVIEVTLAMNLSYTVAAHSNYAMGTANTKTIIINGNNKTLTFNQTNGDWNNVVTNGAKLILNNMNITNVGKNNGPWNRHDINFGCDVELNDVVSDKAIALKAAGTLNNVTIDDANTSDTYAIWIQPNGQTVILDGCTIDMIDCTDGRGIKIDAQYVASPAKVALNISNTTFKTEEKSAVLVKSAAGAHIIWGEGNDITGVKADTYNAVWVDADAADTYDLVTVNGCNKVLEGEIAEGVTMDAEGAYVISKAAGMFWFANQVNVAGNNFSGKTVKLGADIDLKNKNWEPIGQTGATEFKGIFDGQNFTIKNLNIDKSAATDEHTSSGLFGWAEANVTIKNVKVDGAKVKGNHNVAVIVGYTYSGKVSNCQVTNAAIVCTHANDDACGDKCGLIAGYAGDESRFTGCSASDSTVKAGRDAGQLIGAGYNVSVSDCSATNVTVTANGDCTGANIKEALIGRVMG